MKYLKSFLNHSEYTATTITDKPNTSYCKAEREVHFNPYIIPIVTAKFNVTDESNPTPIMCYTAKTGSYFSKIEIDGVKYETFDSAYTLSVGEHTVVYTLNNTKTIGTFAFSACTNMTSVVIGNGVEATSGMAFYGCSSLTSVTIPNSIKSMSYSEFCRCSSLPSVSIPNSVTNFNLCSDIFGKCTSLTSVTIPDNANGIPNGMVANCTSLSSFTIPNSVTKIQNYAFSGCSNLSSITIPNNVTTIAYQSFANCSKLASITSLPTTAPNVGATSFQGIKSNGTLYVPQGSSGYDVWMGTGNYYLGKYNWTKVEQ